MQVRSIEAARLITYQKDFDPLGQPILGFNELRSLTKHLDTFPLSKHKASTLCQHEREDLRGEEWPKSRPFRNACRRWRQAYLRRGSDALTTTTHLHASFPSLPMEIPIGKPPWNTFGVSNNT
jgi:hypothetical protein